MTTPREENLVSTSWLADRLDAPDLVIVDASWYLPDMQRDARAEYLERHIPGAVFLDIDEVSDRGTHLPHMLPSPEQFASQMRKLGIGDGQKIVVYDGAGLFSAARVWWMLRTMGARDVSILDGGLPKWIAEDRPLDSGEVKRQERHFTARLDHGAIRELNDMRRVVERQHEQILDARSAGRFRGEEPEPREGLRSGHMPGSLNLSYRALLNPDGTVKSDEELSRALQDAGVDPQRPVVTTCGSGVTAAILTLGLTLAGHRRMALYDGSWSEWGGAEDAPVETGTP